MTTPLYLDGNPIIGHITYMCPECGEELHRNQRCPHCNKKAIGRDLIAEDIRNERYLDDLLEQRYEEGW